MTIDPARGEIVWPRPATQGSPHGVTATVTDQEGTTRSVAWTMTVTSAGFRFIDAVAGLSAASGGTGTIDNPWLSIADMYEGTDDAAKYLGSYADNFLYFRNGTYAMNAYAEESGRVPLVCAGPQTASLAGVSGRNADPRRE